jgi:hypothetical protein
MMCKKKKRRIKMIQDIIEFEAIGMNECCGLGVVRKKNNNPK